MKIATAVKQSQKGLVSCIFIARGIPLTPKCSTVCSSRKNPSINQNCGSGMIYSGSGNSCHLQISISGSIFFGSGSIYSKRILFKNVLKLLKHTKQTRKDLSVIRFFFIAFQGAGQNLEISFHLSAPSCFFTGSVSGTIVTDPNQGNNKKKVPFGSGPGSTTLEYIQI